MSFIALRSVLPLGRRNIALDLGGIGTSWSAGTTFSLSGTAATGSSITGKIVHSATSARLVLTTGTTAGTLTISDGATSVNLTVKAIPRWPAKAWIPGL